MSATLGAAVRVTLAVLDPATPCLTRFGDDYARKTSVQMLHWRSMIGEKGPTTRRSAPTIGV
jgi:hypothetical protein